MTDWLKSLTAAQREAVLHIDGPLLILAGPGSGKTRVITCRIANLLRNGVAARYILALTFTNKAAEEMRSRVAALAPGEPVWTSTFHRFCARLLRRYAAHVGLSENYTIYDTSDSRQTLKRVLNDLQIDTNYFPPDRIAAGISWAKNNLITADRYEPRPGNPLGNIIARIYPAYQQRLSASNAVDFDDLLLHVATILRDSNEVRAELDARYRYILVDEYQDTNLAQYAIVRGLSIDYPHLAVTGDPDQSIYGWRGANLKNILDFEHDFPAVRTVRLEQNYRSTKNILSVADALISHNIKRKIKALFTENDVGQPVQLITYPNQQDEAEVIAARIAAAVRDGRRRPRDFAIFYRTNALSRNLEFALRDQGVPYQMVNGLEFYQRKEIKDVIAYLQLLNNPHDDVAWLRIINVPARGIGLTSIKRLTAHATAHGISLLDAARQAGLVDSLGKKSALAFARFVSMYDRLSLVSIGPVEITLRQVLQESGYHESLSKSEHEEDQERLANIEELITAARQFDEHHPGPGQLEAFLEDASLVNDTDAWADDDDRVTLMTMHASKGLEFPVVFIIAVEEGLLPHERSRLDADQLEEERRLLFVGMTRAMEELSLSMAQYREFRGVRRPTIPSQFLMELPRGEMELIGPAGAGRSVAVVDPSAAEHYVDEEYAEEEHRHNTDETHEEEPMQHDDSQTFDETNDELGSAAQPPGKFPRLHQQSPDDALAADAPRPAAQASSSSPASMPRLMTAAQLGGGSPSESGSLPPEVFQPDMMVVHPAYGLGKIVTLSGAGAKRQATVRFVAGGSAKKFMLLQSPLRPAK